MKRTSKDNAELNKKGVEKKESRVKATQKSASKQNSFQAMFIESEEKFNAFINRLPCGIYRTSRDGALLFVNLTFAKMLGFDSPEDLLNKSAYDFYVTKFNRDEILEQITNFDNPSFSKEYQLIRRDGALIWVRDTGSVNFSDDDKSYYYEGIIEDISQSKDSEETISDYERKERQLFENLQDTYYQFDLSGRIYFATPSAERLTGYGKHELMGMNIRNLLAEGNDARHFMSTIVKTGRINGFIAPMRRKDGSRIIVETNAHFISDSAGRIQGVEGLTRDINSEVKSKEYLAAMYSISKAINNTKNYDELYSAIHSALREIIDAKNFFIAIADRERGIITFPYFVDERNNSVGEIELYASESLTAKVIINGEPLLLSEDDIETMVYRKSGFIGPKTKCWLGVPLRTGGKVIGALGLQSYSNPNLYTQENLDMLEPVSDQIALAIDLKRSSLALSFQLEFLQNLMNTIPSPIYHKNLQRIYVGCNQAFENYFGIREKELIGKNVFDIFPEEFALFADAADIDLLMNPRVQQYETIIKMFDGSVRNVVFYKTCYNDHYGKTAGLVGVMMDITDRKKAEKDLKEAKEYAELIHRITPNCVYTTDESGSITSWNKRIAEVTGYDAEEALGKKCDFLCVKNVNKCPLSDPSRDYPIFNFEQEIFTKSGKKRIITVNIDKIRDYKGNEKGMIVCFDDITGKKRIEESLYWQAGVNSAIASLSKAMMSLASIQEISDLILFQARKLTGAKAGYVGYAMPEKSELVIPAYTSNFFANPIGNKEKHIQSNGDAVIIRNTGGIAGLALSGRATVVTNDTNREQSFNPAFDGEVKKFICAPAILGDTVFGLIAIGNPDRDFELDDVEIIERMASLYAIAVHRVRAEDETRCALQKEQELSELKTRFISTVSHEYRTPLTAIMLSTELLSDYGERLNKDEKSKHYSRILDSVNIMNGLLDDIISFNRFELGKVQVKYSFMDLEKFCKMSAESAEFMFKKKCPIVYERIGANYLVYSDEKLLYQIVSNILSNAIKYSPEGSEVKIISDASGYELELRIIDKGIGIPESEQPKVFEPFYRGENVGTISGTGLGMSIVRNSLRLLGGSVTFKSSAKEGTEFFVRIPISNKQEIA